MRKKGAGHSLQEPRNAPSSPLGLRHTAYELRLRCGMEVLRVQFFTPEGLRELAARLAELE